jgi:MFS family permease
MNNVGVRKTLQLLFIFYTVAFAVFVLYALFTYPAGQLVDVFLNRYLFTRGLVLFIDAMIPLTISVAAISYSVSFRQVHGQKRETRPFFKLISANLTLFIVLAVLYTVLLLGVQPLAWQRLNQMAAQSQQADLFLKWAEELTLQGDFRQANRYLDLYLLIDGENKEVLEQKEEVNLKALRQMADEEAVEQISTQERPAEGYKAHELLAQAEVYFAEEDYFSAHYYATQAFRIDSSRVEAQRLASRAWEKIASLDLSNEEKEQQELFRRKQHAYRALLEGAYIRAYTEFNQLYREYPNDSEVRKYYQESRDKVAGVTYFKDEVQEIEPRPGYDDLLFLNSAPDEPREIVYIQKAVVFEEETIFQNIEIIRFHERLVSHLRAPYGKAQGDMAVLTGIDRDAPQRQLLPVYLSGKPGAETPLYPLPQLSTLVNLRAWDKASSLGTDALWRLRRNIGRYGYIEEHSTMTLINRLMLPFCFLTLSLFAVSLGWSFRTRTLRRPPLISFLFIPFFPFMASVISDLYLAVQRVIVGFVLVSVGFSAALVVMIAVQAMLFVLALVWLAGQGSSQS